jgi:5,10-methylenetetrahydromethanopterin reductase
MIEFGIILEPSPGYTAPLATEVEELGFDILLCPDTQNLSPDPIGQLNLASQTTTRLKLGTGVTNPITRDVAVISAALATLQVESKGRVICGMGRGDSSAAHIGKPNATTAELRLYAERFKTYVGGGTVMRGEKESNLRWLDSVTLDPIPLDIACTGPKTIEMAVDIADRVSFAVGSAPERIAWAMEVAEHRLAVTGRPRDSIQIGAYVNLVCDPDEQRAIELGRLVSGMVAHFAGMKDVSLAHLPKKLHGIAAYMQQGYDMQRHAKDGGSHQEVITDEFVDWFSICGPAEKCRTRLQELLDMGLQHVYQLGGTPVSHPHGERQRGLVNQARHFALNVMPHFRQPRATNHEADQPDAGAARV